MTRRSKTTELMALVISTMALSAACGDDDASHSSDGGNPDAADGDSGIHADAQLGYAHQRVSTGCAPDDGQALSLDFGDVSAAQSTCEAKAGPPSVHIELWDGISNLPGTVSFTNDVTGRATQCPGEPDPCRTADSGEVRFDTYMQGGSASGTWTLRFGAETVSSSFIATWCGVDIPLCG